jgi:hypothetical protein
VAAACTALAERIARIGAHLLKVDPAAVAVAGGEVRRPHARGPRSLCGAG